MIETYNTGEGLESRALVDDIKRAPVTQCLLPTKMQACNANQDGLELLL